jgi:thioredoxin reductase
LDRGQPRQAAAPISHGFLTRDGVPPSEIAAAARSQLHAYPTVQQHHAVASAVRQVGALFEVRTAATVYVARRLLFAHGVHEQLPPVPGSAECWGRSLFPCPYCHAWEYQDRPLGLIKNGAGMVPALALLQSWSRSLHLLTNGPPDFALDEQRLLAANRVSVHPQPIRAFQHHAGQLQHVVFADGATLALAALIYNPPVRPDLALLQQLGLVQNNQINVKPETGQTANPNVYLAGDLLGAHAHILPAATFSGANAARHLNLSLAIEDFTAAAP